MFIRYSATFDDPSILTIFDSDFEEKISVKYTDIILYAEVIINLYSRKQLYVAKNLYKYMKYNEITESKRWNYSWQFEIYKKYIKKFEQYTPQLEKYLLMEA